MKKTFFVLIWILQATVVMATDGKMLFTQKELKELEQLKKDKYFVAPISEYYKKENEAFFYSHMMILLKAVSHEYKSEDQWKKLERLDHEKMFQKVLNRALLNAGEQK